MAFVSSFTPSVKSSSLSSATAVTSRTAPHPPTIAAPVSMKVDITERIKAENKTFRYLEDNRRAKEASLYTPQRGFTEFAETLNGRMAMMGFVIGLTTELITGKGINAQLAALFAPIFNLHL